MKRILLTLVLTLVAATALPQQYPAKPIKFIVGFPPGGSADPTTRIMGAALAEQMGQPMVVELCSMLSLPEFVILLCSFQSRGN